MLSYSKVFLRAMTGAEINQARVPFPNLNGAAAVVTGEATGVYNCIAWTINVTNRWVWPGATKADFDTLYGTQGLRFASTDPVSTRKVAIWGYSFSNLTHGSTAGTGHGPRWESKAGAWLRFQHGRDELTNMAPNQYGKIMGYYSAQRTVAKPSKALADFKRSLRVAPKKLGVASKKLLAADRTGLSDAERAKFDTLFNQWVESWKSKVMLSDPKAYATGDAFDKLVAMGPKVAPLVVEKMHDPKYPLALQLHYAVLHPRAKASLLARHAKAKAVTEQHRAAIAIDHYFNQ